MKKISTLHKVVALAVPLWLAVVTLAVAGGTSESKGTTSASSGPVSLSLFVDQTWYPYKDWSGPIPEEITKTTGVNPVVTIASDEKQLPLLIASGSLPDLVATSTQHKRMGTAEISLAWDDLIKKYAPDFTIEPTVVAINTAADGHFYTVRNNFSTAAEFKAHQGYALDATGAILARADILQALGNPAVNTLDDFVNLLQAVKNKYPDLTPLVLNTPVWGKPYFANQFGVSDVTDIGFNDVDGRIVHMLHMPEYRAMYLYMNDLFTKGFINAENFAYKQDQQSVDLAANGKAFAVEWTTATVGNLNARTKTAGNQFQFVYLPVKINSGFKVESHNVGWQGVYITKNNRDPKASINFMKLLYSTHGQQLTMYGREGTDWNWSADGNYPVFKYAFFDDAARAKLGTYYWGLLIDSAVTEMLTRFDPGTETTRVSQEFMKLQTQKPAVGLVVPDADTPEAVILANIKNMIPTEETKVFLAPSRDAASQAYDDMVAKAEQMGLGKLEAWANAKYDGVKKLFP